MHLHQLSAEAVPARLEPARQRTTSEFWKCRCFRVLPASCQENPQSHEYNVAPVIPSAGCVVYREVKCLRETAGGLLKLSRWRRVRVGTDSRNANTTTPRACDDLAPLYAGCNVPCTTGTTTRSAIELRILKLFFVLWAYIPVVWSSVENISADYTPHLSLSNKNEKEPLMSSL